MNAFVAAPAAQPPTNSECWKKKTTESKHSHISLQSFDSLTNIYCRSPFMLCIDVMYFPYPKYALRDHLSH